MCLGLLLTITALTASPAWSARLPSGFTPIVKPPIPPRSTLLSDRDLSQFEKALAAADARKWTTALDLASQIVSPVPKKIIMWRFLQKEDTTASTAEITDFVNANPDWPRVERLLQRAETEMPGEMPARQVITWFAGQEPITGEGKFRLGEAYAETGQKDYADYWIRDAWANHDLTPKLETALLKQHIRRLTKETHAARVTRLLWSNKTTAARRVLGYLAKDDRAVANARLALMARGSIKTALANVPKSRRNDPGLIYEQVLLHRRAERNTQALATLFLAPKDPALLVRPDKWWNERHILARRAIKEEKYEDAYELASRHGSPSGASFAEAEWLAGWLALRFLHDPAMAENHFTRLYEGVSYPISKSRALYWRGRAVEAADATQRAAGYYAAASQYYMTFYGQLAREQLDAGQSDLVIPARYTMAPGTEKALGERSVIQALRLLALTDQGKTLRVFLFHLADQLSDPNDLAALSDLMGELGHPHLGVRVAKKASLKHIFLPARAYPLTAIDITRTAPGSAEPALVLGLSRQESEFNPRAVSRAGARGLMQLMPATAKIVARQQGVSFNKNKLLDDPSYNLTLGSAHLGDLIDRFDGSYILTIASYNAGAHRARQWIQDYGDPRLPSVDAIDWIEKIPFNETRNYVQRVLENTQIYRTYLASGAPTHRLHVDLGLPMAPSKLSRYAMASPDLMLANIVVDAPRREVPVPQKKNAPALAENTAGLTETLPVKSVPLTLASLTPTVDENPKPLRKPLIAPAAPPQSKAPQSPPVPVPMASLAPQPPSSPQTQMHLTGKTLPLRPMSSLTPETSVPFMEPVREAGDQTADLPSAAMTQQPPNLAALPKQSAPAAIKGCKLFIPDSTGGGTCADLAEPAISAQRLTDLGQPDDESEVQTDMEECDLFIPDSTGSGTCADLPQ